jgi:putative ABC transport system substrate-binding protein
MKDPQPEGHMASHIGRRKFLAALGGAAAWPLTARAQQAERMRRVAFLHPYAENDPEVLARVVAFRQGLEALGWAENRNIQIEHRYSGGDLGQIQAYATELVRSAPDLIVGSGTPITAALKQATDTIPIVFNVVNDPVGQGFVATLSHPGGNITGFTFMDFPLIGKWLEMLKEIAPDVRRITLMFNPDSAPFYPVFLREFGAAPASLAVELSASPVHDEAEIEAAVTAFAREPRGGLIPAPDAFINTRRHLIMALAERHRLPCDLWFSAIRHGRRADVLWTRRRRYCPAFGLLRRSYSQGREADRPAGAGAGQIRFGA